MSVNITVSPVGKPPGIARQLPITIPLSPTSTVGELKTALAAQFPKFYTSRQKITLTGEKKALDDEVALSAVGLVNGSQVSIKDLGPQISWRTVFVIEYAGPLVIHPLIYHLPRLFYGQSVQHSSLQRFMYVFTMLHFLKRELETLFVHRFSHATMPARNIVKNSAHYHILSGLFLAYDLYRPAFSAKSSWISGTIRDDPRFLWAGAAFLLFAELSNLKTHLITRSLRPSGTRTRAVPYGYGFNLVSMPNYFFEILAWTGVCVITGSWAATLFLAVAGGQMAVWAVKKHVAYKKEFGKEYPRGRKILIPYIW